MNHISSENYLKCIYHLETASGDAASTNLIAAHLGTKPSSVTSMLMKLGKSGLVEYVPYQGASLTKEGKKKAIQIVRKHRLWESFLVNKLGLSWESVHEIAEQLEHIDSEILVEKLDEYLGFPTRDPHGDPIPDSKGKIKSDVLVPLVSVSISSKAKIAGVLDHSTEFLKHLATNGLIPGQSLRIEHVENFDGMMCVLLMPENKRQYISKHVAENILILEEK